jgi:hypothetical protein
LASRIRDATREGQDVVKFLVAVMNGREKQAKMSDRIQAATILLDRGFGKPLSEVNLNVSGEVNHLHSLASWTLEELDALIQARDMLLAAGYRPELGKVVEGEVGNSLGAP